jgi:hypothetical protein
LGGPALAQPTAVPILLFGGRIYVGEGRQFTSVMMIRDGRIAYLGDQLNQTLRAAGGAARMVDLAGATVFPGFVDSHAHLSGIGLREMTLNLEGAASVDDLVARLGAWAARNPQGVISGRGWIETHWPEKRFPTAADLDRAVADRPVVLTRADGHALVANTAALRLGGVTASTADPQGGQILKSPDGRPTGMLIDNAMRLVASKVPPPTAADRREALRRAVRLYAGLGWTGVHNMSASAEDVAILKAMADAGELPIRVDNYLNVGDAAEVLSAGPGDHLGRVGVRGVKLYMDGALGSRGAALLAPYADAPGTGLITTPVEEIDRVLRRARGARAQVALHAIGDRGNRLALEAFARAFGGDAAALRAARWRIEHAQVVAPEDLPKFAQLGVIASMQPSHAIGDLHFAPARLGPERLAGAYAWNTLMRSGALVCGGSDAPVERGDPLIEFYAAAHRHDLKGFAGPDWRPQEALSREDALKMLAVNPAFASFREGELGPLRVGRRADITVFSEDLMSAPFADIPKARALMTIVDGRIVHNAL